MNTNKPIEFTEEENKAVKEMLASLENKYFRKDMIEIIRTASAAKALEVLATENMERAFSKNSKVKRMEVGTKAMDSIKKAYLIHPLPAYLCVMADFAFIAEEQAGAKNNDMSRKLYKEFIKAQESHTPNKMDELVLEGWNVPTMLEEAKKRIKTNLDK